MTIQNSCWPSRPGSGGMKMPDMISSIERLAGPRGPVEKKDDIILSAEHLSKIYRRPSRADLTAVSDVSFSLRRGESLGLVGESGCGKSTLAAMLLLLLKPTSGDIKLEGKSILSLKRKELPAFYRDVQMIFQLPSESFDPLRTVGESIAEPLRIRGASRGECEKAVRGLLSLCGLPADYADRFPRQLSGGECQRAAIARAVSLRPRVLVCDEATSALDVSAVHEVAELLRFLQELMNLSILFISHDIALVQSLCQRMMIMRQGKILEEGECDALIRSPKDTYTRDLIAGVL